MVGKKGDLERERSSYLLKMDDLVVAANTDAEKKQVVDDISTMALYLHSAEDCLFTAMINHTGVADREPDVEKFNHMYLKFLILVDNDPGKKTEVLNKVKAKLEKLATNKHGESLTADMQALDQFYSEHLVGKGLDSLNADIAKHLDSVHSSLRKFSSVGEATVAGAAGLDIGVHASLLMMEAAIIYTNMKEGMSVGDSLKVQGRGARMLTSASLIGLSAANIVAGGISPVLRVVPYSVLYASRLAGNVARNGKIKREQQVINSAQASFVRSVDAHNENNMLVNLGASATKNGQFYSESFVYNEIIKDNENVKEIQRNTLFLHMANQNLHEKLAQPGVDSTAILAVKSDIEEKLKYNTARLNNNEKLQQERNNMKNNAKNIVKTSAILTGALLMPVAGAVAAVGVGAGVCYSAVKLAQSSAGLRHDAQQVKEKKHQQHAGFSSDQYKSVFNMTNNEAKKAVINKIIKINSKKHQHTKRRFLPRIVKKVRTTKYHNLKKIVDNTAGLSDKSAAELKQDAQRKRNINISRHARGLQEIDDTKSYTIDEAYANVVKIIEPDMFSSKSEGKDYSEIKHLIKDIALRDQLEQELTNDITLDSANKLSN